MMVSIVKDVGLRRVLFFGDSTMKLLWKQARQFLNQHINPVLSKIITERVHNTHDNKTLNATGCNNLNLKCGKSLIKQEKDLCYSVLAQWCTFWQKCNTTTNSVKNEKNILSVTDFGFISFRQDLKFPSVFENAKQITLSQYLQWHGKLYSSCVVNSGQHDQHRWWGVELQLSKEGYILNMKGLLEFLFPVCSHIIWIETTAPRGDKEWHQRADRTREFNTALESYLETHFNSKVSVVRVFDKSLEAKHKDNVHLDELWYLELARTLFEKVLNVS